MSTDLDNDTIVKAYARWAPVYDLVFGAVFEHGRHAAIAAAERVGGRILEVGVGTGISLPDYARSNRLVGPTSRADAAPGPGAGRELGLDNVEGLEVMDAEQLELSDESFDVIVAQCVVNTVPHAEVALDEFARVLKAGGEIVLLNRVGAEGGPRLAFERWFQPTAQRLGWQSDFPWGRFARWLEATPYDVRLIERRPVPPLGHFSLIRFGKASADRRDGIAEHARAA
jgi:phosphatidylethanolamine/phosphatidyl-N-methylethanolamine N-methyltransferase